MNKQSIIYHQPEKSRTESILPVLFFHDLFYLKAHFLETL